MPRPAAIDFAAAARRYQVSTRTCRRWHAAGVDIDNPEAVAAHLLRLKRPSVSALKTLSKLL